jgi:hypothetical protein
MPHELASVDDRDHAFEVIDRLLRRPEDHQAIRSGLAMRGGTFPNERFAAEARALLREESPGEWKSGHDPALPKSRT